MLLPTRCLVLSIDNIASITAKNSQAEVRYIFQTKLYRICPRQVLSFTFTSLSLSTPIFHPIDHPIQLRKLTFRF